MPEPGDDDLDEYALEHTRVEDEQRTQGVAARPGAPGARAFPAVLAGLALLAVGGLALLFVTLRRAATHVPATAETAAAAQPGARASQTQPAPPTLGPLPDLDESDDYVRRAASVLSRHPEVARWLGQTNLVRSVTAVVTNVADGESPRPHLGFLAPAQRFRVVGRTGRTVADPAGFVGYDRFADALASVDTDAAVSTYRAVEPLFEAAYRDLGHPEGGFRSEIERAIAVLVATPVPPADAGLQAHAVGFRYVDPRFEQLTAAQKQFLRLGPRNVRVVQAKLEECQAALGRTTAPASNTAR